MKLLFLAKRRPQGRDLLEDPFGRFYYLPKILSEKKHDINLLLFSHKKEAQSTICKENINWTSLSLLKHGPFAYVREAQKIINKIKPDWIIGFSDIYYGILAQRLGAQNRINSLIDAYDNFESYIPWFKPLHKLWRASLSKATLVTAAGPGLADLLKKSRPGIPTAIIPMAADPIFQPMDKVECRKKLGLPANKKLIGYSGSTIHTSRGIDLLFDAFDSLMREIPNIQLVLSGRIGHNITIPAAANWLGYIPDEHMPLLMNSLDVFVVMNKPSAFGNYSYPIKLYEAMKCQIPIVVSQTLSTKWIMKDNNALLVEPDNLEKLSAKIKYAINLEKIDYGMQLSWEQIGIDFEKLLLDKQKIH